jgi:hypothetical protein
LVVQVDDEKGAKIWTDDAIWKHILCKDHHVLFIDYCEITTWLQGVSNNIIQIANSNTLNIIPLRECVTYFHPTKIIERRRV